MNAVIIIILALLGALVIYALKKMRELDNRIDDIYNKAFTMQGEIEANTARSKDNYKLIAQMNTYVEKVQYMIEELHKHEPADEPAKEVEAELEHLIKEKEEEENTLSELDQRRIEYAKYRKQGMGIKEAGIAVGVSHSTAKRYEQWRTANKK